MNTAKAQKTRNQTLECLKLFAALFIVYAHVLMPERDVKLIDCLVRFTVPLFLAVSGYFSYSVRFNGLIKRFWHIVRLNLYAVLAIVSFNCCFAAVKGGSAVEVLLVSLPTVRQLINWVLLHVNPIEGHLWYLAAIAATYAVLAVYVRFFGEEKIDYRPLYIVGAALFLIRFAATDMLNRLSGFDIPFYFLRDGWFFGIPMFSLGLFLRQYQEQILKNFALTSKKLVLLLLAGIALSLMQYLSLGPSELPVGAAVQVVAMMLLAHLHPTVDCGSDIIRRIVSTFGSLSTTVYVIQFCVYDVYAYWFFGFAARLFGPLEIWVRPFLIFLGGCIVGLLLIAAKKAAKRLLPR